MTGGGSGSPIVKLGISAIVGYVLASLIHPQASGGWASSKKKEEENTKKEIRVAKGIGNCICRNNVYTGAGCPYIGQLCNDPKGEFHPEVRGKPVTAHFPTTHQHTTCPAGSILTPQGACIKPERWQDIEEHTRRTQRDQNIAIAWGLSKDFRLTIV